MFFYNFANLNYNPATMNKLYCILLLLQCFIVAKAQVDEKKSMRIMCYNVENLFDCVDDSLTNDAEYLPGGMRGWNYQKYQLKLANIGKVITAVGGWEAPALVGLCEIESERCMLDLTRFSGLKSLKYKFVHYESPDARGVDVALLYQPSKFKPIVDKAVRIDFPNAPQSKTRDILYAAGIIPTGDTLHVFVCHFPSRLGGELESEDRRMYVAQVLRQEVDSLFSTNTNIKIIIMGDFNDYPENKSMAEVLKAQKPEKEIRNDGLYNLMFPLHLLGKGSHKHEGKWGALDQMIVSGSLLNPTNSCYTLWQDVKVFDPDFLLEDDKHYLGKQPARTYVGMSYKGGFSDDLPVFTDLWY